jgi:hypothetical protein
MTPEQLAALEALLAMMTAAIAEGVKAIVAGSTVDEAAMKSVASLEDQRAKAKFPGYEPG